MKLNKIFFACFVIVVFSTQPPMLAQAAQAVIIDKEMAEIRQAIQRLEKQHAEDKKRIEELEKRLEKYENIAYQAPKNAVTPASSPAPPIIGQTPAVASESGSSTFSPPPSNAPASAGAFNPAIGVVLMGTYTNFGHDPKKSSIPGFALGEDAIGSGTQGFSLNESEVSLSANIDQALYGELILSYSNDGGVDVENGFIQTTSLPYGFTAKAGRFFSGIGYLNEQHQHAWDFLDAPLPYRVMLNNQLGDDGVQLRWTAPTDMLLQFGVEALRGGGFPATSTNNGVGAQSVFVKAGGDVNESNSWLASLAYYHADADNRETDAGTYTGTVDTYTGSTDIGIAGLVWKWAPNGNPVQRNLKLQGEFFYQHQNGTFDSLPYKGNQTGFYTQAVYQFMPRWSFGIRYDQVTTDGAPYYFSDSTLDSLGNNPHRYSGVLAFSVSEFSRFALQYNYDSSAPEANQGIMLNYTVSLGAHGAHQY
jgi:hypothetical protein